MFQFYTVLKNHLPIRVFYHPFPFPLLRHPCPLLAKAEGGREGRGRAGGGGDGKEQPTETNSSYLLSSYCGGRVLPVHDLVQ